MGIVINVNRCSNGIALADFPYGKTQNVEVKVGRKLYMVDVDKNALSANIDFYRKVSSDRGTYSKYDLKSELVSVRVEKDARLCRDFFENIREISKAQNIYRKYSRLLAM